MHKWEVYGSADHIGLTAKPLSWLKLSDCLFAEPLLLFSWNNRPRGPELRCSPVNVVKLLVGMDGYHWVFCVPICEMSLMFFFVVHSMSCLSPQWKFCRSPGRVCSTPLPSCCAAVLLAIHWSRWTWLWFWTWRPLWWFLSPGFDVSLHSFPWCKVLSTTKKSQKYSHTLYGHQPNVHYIAIIPSFHVHHSKLLVFGLAI